jgi:hypothetical protein
MSRKLSHRQIETHSTFPKKKVSPLNNRILRCHLFVMCMALSLRVHWRVFLYNVFYCMLVVVMIYKMPGETLETHITHISTALVILRMNCRAGDCSIVWVCSMGHSKNHVFMLPYLKSIEYFEITFSLWSLMGCVTPWLAISFVSYLRC